METSLYKNCAIGEGHICSASGCQFLKRYNFVCTGRKNSDFASAAMNKQEEEINRVILTTDMPLSKKQKVYRRDKGICYLCGKPVIYSLMSLDHVYPRSLGGSSKMSNLKTTHRDCNNAKGSMLLEEYLNIAK